MGIGRGRNSAIIMLKTLFLLLLKEVLSINDEAKCQLNPKIARQALAEIYVVDKSSDITRAFYHQATCWLGSERVKDLWDDKDWPTPGRIEIVVDDPQLVRVLQTRAGIRLTALHQCDTWTTACLNRPKVVELPGDVRIIRAYPSDYRYSSLFLLTGNTSYEEERVSEYSVELARSYHSRAIRMGGIVILVIVFILLTCAVCCHSSYILTMLFDDAGWRREQIMQQNNQDLFLDLPPEEADVATAAPLRSPAPSMQTAMSRLSSYGSKTSVSSFGTNSTQASRTSASLVSLG